MITTLASASRALAISTNCCSGMLNELTGVCGSIEAPARSSNFARAGYARANSHGSTAS